jgi:uncharacterized protein (DUF4415 family)
MNNDIENLPMSDEKLSKMVALEEALPELAESLRKRGRPALTKHKERVTVRLDADVLAWLRSSGSSYQTRMNALLRSMMEKQS